MSDAVLDVPFIGGPDDQSDNRLSAPGTVVSAFNQTYDQDGSYQPRFGYVELENTLPNVRKLATLGTDLCGIDGQKLYIYDDVQKAWQLKDDAPCSSWTHRPLYNTSNSFSGYDSAASGGYRVVAWQDVAGFVYCAVFAVDTNTMVLGPVLLDPSTGVQPHVAIVGTTALVTWIDTLTPSVFGATIDLTAVSSGVTFTGILSDATHDVYSASPGYALCASATLFFLAYETTPTGTTPKTGHIIVRQLDTTATPLFTTNVALAAHVYHMISMSMVAKDGGDLWVLASDQGGILDSTATPYVFLLRFDPATLSFTAGPIDCGATPALGIASTGVEITATGECVATWSSASAGFYFAWYTVAGIVSGSPNLLFGMTGATTPLHIAEFGQTQVMVYGGIRTSQSQGPWSSYYIVNLGTSAVIKRDPVAVLAPRIVNLGTLSVSAVWNATPRMAFSSQETIEVISPIVRNTGRSGLDLFQGYLEAPFAWSPTSLGREHYLGGQIYDGNMLAEVGYTYNPSISNVSSSGSGSFTGTWEYTYTFGRTNAAGDFEESAPAPAMQVTAASKSQFDITLYPMILTQKSRQNYGDVDNGRTPIYLVIYRTRELSSGDTLHYRVYNEPFPAAIRNNEFATAQITIHDTTVDADLINGTHPILYTDSGELPHNCPETFTHVITHKNRVFGIGADQRTIWYSQVYSDGVTPSFNEVQQLTVDDSSEPLIALASLYDKLLIFTATRIYVVYGDGPSISGAGNDFTQPQRIPSASGCLDPRSIVNTPMGVMSQGIQGLTLIDAGLGVTFLGKNITNALAPYPVCTSSAWCEDSNTVRFSFETSELNTGGVNAASGVLALFDVRRSRWAVHQVTNRLGGPDGAPVQAACWHPTFGYCQGSNELFDASCIIGREATTSDATPWLDYGSHFVPLKVTCCWIKDTDGNGQKLQGALRYRRVRLLGQFYNQHALEVQIGYDYQAPSESHAFTSAQVTGFVVGDREQVRVIPARGKAEAIQITLTTVAPSPVSGAYTGRGAGFTGIQYEVHARKGGFRNIGAGAKS